MSIGRTHNYKVNTSALSELFNLAIGYPITAVFVEIFKPNSKLLLKVKLSDDREVYTAKLSGDNYHYWALSRGIVIY